MTDNVIDMFPANNPDHVLEGCKGKFEQVLIMGWDKDGVFQAYSGGDVSLGECHYLSSLLASRIISGEYGYDESH